MRKTIVLIVVAVHSVFAAAIQAQPSDSLAGVRSYYENGLGKNGIVGSSLVLIRNGGVILHDNYGRQSLTPAVRVDDNTTYHWASCTKTFTGIAIMQLRDRGLLSP